MCLNTTQLSFFSVIVVVVVVVLFLLSCFFHSKALGLVEVFFSHPWKNFLSTTTWNKTVLNILQHRNKVSKMTRKRVKVSQCHVMKWRTQKCVCVWTFSYIATNIISWRLDRSYTICCGCVYMESSQSTVPAQA